MAKQKNQKDQSEAVRDDLIIRARWCGYHGGPLVADQKEFLSHLNQCEIDIADNYHRKLGCHR